MRADLVITGLGVVCPGADDAAEAAAVVPGAQDGAWFDPRAVLGPRGYKYLPPACQYMLAATRRALADAGAAQGEGWPPSARRAAAIGTNSAAEALHATTDDVVMQRSADDLSPATSPFFSINLYGSRLAMEHDLRAFNLTLTTPRIAGLEALHAGKLAMTLGRADALIAGATEAPLPGGQTGADASEDGAVALTLETASGAAARGAPVRGTCNVRTLFVSPRRLASHTVREAAVARVRSALAELSGGARLPLRMVTDDSAVGTVLQAAAGDAELDGLDRRPAGAGSLAPLRHLLALLGTADRDWLLATAAAEGHVALVLVSPRHNGVNPC